MNAAAALSLSAMSLVFGVVIGAAVSPPVVRHYLNQERRAICWNGSVKLSASSLALQLGEDIFKPTIPAEFTETQRKAAEASFAVSLDDYFAMGGAPDSAVTKCGAEISYTYTRRDGQPYSHADGDIVSFDVYPSESGPSATMRQADLLEVGIAYRSPGQ